MVETESFLCPSRHREHNWALESLSYRERRVLKLRYGLGGEHPCTLDVLSRAFNVTRERIRQIEFKALHKLQALVDTDRLGAVGEAGDFT